MDKKCKQTGKMVMLDNMEKVFLGSYLSIPKNYTPNQGLIRDNILKEFKTLQAPTF